MSRRSVLKSVAATAGVGLLPGIGAAEEALALKGHIKHSIVQWCFKDHWDVEKTCQVAKEMGCQSVELVSAEHTATLKKYGLTNAMMGSHGFVKGMNDPQHWEYCTKLITASIDHSADAGFERVITFTGMRNGIPDDVGMKNCVEGYKKIIGYAEKKKITLCLEMLNSRVSTHAMKGHPGYQGDHTDYCIEIIKAVGSDRLKLLFDIYHVQIMDGDVIARLRQHKDYIGHIHTAGNPGRGELDDTQEINYPPIMRALVEIGFTGYVGHEFIPTREPLAGLRQAMQACDV